MKRYQEYTMMDFVMDDHFREWVLSPTAEVEEFWNYWLKCYPDKHGEVEKARLLVLSVDFQKTPVENIPEEAILNRIRMTIREGEPVKNNNRHPVWMKIAASLVVLITAGLILFLKLSYSSQEIVFQTEYNQKQTIILPDQSQVMLNSNSTLHYSKEWNSEKTREVWLEGEAFFKVRKSPGQGNVRFIVHTKTVNVEVLGTVFNVNERHGNAKVVLKSGKVKLISSQAREKEIMMMPGEMAELKKGEKKFSKKTVNPQEYSSWTSDKLLFNKTPLKDIINLIQDNYGYTVETSVKEIEDVTFSASIPSTDLDVLLSILSESYGITIRKSDRTILISRKQSQ